MPSKFIRVEFQTQEQLDRFNSYLNRVAGSRSLKTGKKMSTGRTIEELVLEAQGEL